MMEPPRRGAKQNETIVYMRWKKMEKEGNLLKVMKGREGRRGKFVWGGKERRENEGRRYFKAKGSVLI